VRILAWPRSSTSNPIFGAINQSLGEIYGTTVVEFSIPRLLWGEFDVWHVQFPETVLYHTETWKVLPRLLILRLLVGLNRLRRTKLVWTANNLGSHERNHPRLERWLWSFFLSRIDGFVTHSEAGAGIARHHHAPLDRKRHFVVPEPHFRSLRHDDVGREAARESLGMPRSAKVVLFVGRIRPYKCIDDLIAVFRRCSGPDLRLIIAGRPYTSEIARQLEEMAAKDRRIELIFGHVPEEGIQHYLRGADLLVLPYREIFLSGTALLALSYDRPILVPRRGALAELGEEIGPEWVRLYDGDLTPEELVAALDWARAPRSGPPDLHRHDLGEVTAALQRTYEALLA
jgi:beta-1,4-mannosyltransferase